MIRDRLRIDAGRRLPVVMFPLAFLGLLIDGAAFDIAWAMRARKGKGKAWPLTIKTLVRRIIILAMGLKPSPSGETFRFYVFCKQSNGRYLWVRGQFVAADNSDLF